MQEIEVKILEINKDVICSKLEALGATKTFEGEMEIYYYDFSDLSLDRQGKMLRLRSKGKKAELTFKEKISKVKVKQANETEVIVDNIKKMQRILEKIPLKIIKKSFKKRISYSLEKVHFDLDFYPNIPPLLEIEAPNEKILKEYVEKLGFTMKDTKPWSGKDVMKYYEKKYTKGSTQTL